MNLEQLESISAVVEFGSFRAAAAKLHRSQPALSAAIKKLEDEFDIQIFDRSEYRPTLTEAGAAFLSAAHSTLDAARYASRIARELGRNKAETKLHILVDPLISLEVLELVAQECARPVLPVKLIIDKSIYKTSYLPLLEGKANLAFAYCPEDEERIERISLENVTLVGAVSRKLLQEKRSADQKFIGNNTQVIVYNKTWDEESSEPLSRKVDKGLGHKMYVPDHFTKLRLIQGGIGWGRISKTELEADKNLVPFDSALCPPIHMELCLLRARHRPLGPIAREIWKVFKARSERGKGKK